MSAQIPVTITAPKPPTPIVTPDEVKPLFRPAVKPLSIATEPWTSFGSFDTRIFADDFCHEKHLTTKVKATSIDGSTFNVKLVENFEKGQLKMKDELKFWFPLEGRSQHLHVRLNNNEARLHFDNGISVIKGEKFNIYGSFGFFRDWSRRNVKLGISTVFNNFNTDNRIRVDEYKDVTWYHKTLVRQGKFRFGFIGVLDLTRQILAKKDVLVGYTQDNVDVVLKAEQSFTKPTQNWSNFAEYFSNVVFTTTYKKNKAQRYAVEVSADPSNKKLVASGLVEYKYNDKSLTKIKLNSDLNLALVVKKTLNDTVSLSFGTGMLLTGSDKKVKYGGQIDLSI